MPLPKDFRIPPVDDVRRQLAAAVAEVRMLRSLLQIAKKADAARQLKTACQPQETAR